MRNDARRRNCGKCRGGARWAALLAVGLALAAAGPARASLVYGTSADMTGSRTVPANELVPTQSGFWQSASLSWNITLDDAMFTYEYTFTAFEGSTSVDPAISNVTIDVTDSAVGMGSLNDPNAVTNVMLNDSPASIDFGTFNGVTGVKIEDFPEEEPEDGFADSITLTFESNRRPVWGNIYVKNGQTDLFNRDFNDIGMSMDPQGFIARPNSVIPLPAAAWPGLVLLGGVMTRRRTRRAAGARAAEPG